MGDFLETEAVLGGQAKGWVDLEGVSMTSINELSVFPALTRNWSNIPMWLLLWGFNAQKVQFSIASGGVHAAIYR